MTVHFMAYGLIACMKLDGGPPVTWPEGNKWTAVWNDVTCPDCLKGKYAIDTYTIGDDGKSITCKRCKRTSYNMTDVERRYCGSCHAYHEDIWPPARAWWIANPDPQPH